MFEKLEKFQLVLLALILAFGIFFATKYATNSLSREGISVTGSAYEIVKSDSGRLSFEINVRAVSKNAAYQALKTQLPVVKKYLTDKNIAEADIDVKTYNGYYSYKYNEITGRTTNIVDYYSLSQPIEVASNDVELLKEISTDIQGLLDKGIDINVYQTAYFYSKLSDLKVKLLEAATDDAKQRAAAMLKATHNRVGKIQSVKMGVFQITQVDSTNVSDMGINDTSTIDKKVTAVANVVFKIK